MRKNRKRRTSRKNMMLFRTTEVNGVAMGVGVTAPNVGPGVVAIMKAAMNVNSVHNHVNIKVINVNMVVNAMNSNKGLDVNTKKGVNNVEAIVVVVEGLINLLDTN